MPNQKDKMVSENPPWADLDPDILRCVAAHLSFVDQSRFRAVCKAWRGIRGVKPNDKWPWIIELNHDLPRVDSMQHCEPQSYYLYDVSARKTYTRHINQYITNKYFLSVTDGNVECIKLGWLLFNSVGLFLFNAFTQEVVDLPRFLGDSLKFIFTFSYCERSRLFMVYAARSSVFNEKSILIHTWRSGDGEWKTEEFVPEIVDRMNAIFKVECVGDTLYCVFRSGVVGTFQGGNKDWSLVVEYGEDVSLFATFENNLCKDKSAFTFKFLPLIYYIRAQVVEIEGDIFLVCFPNNRWEILRLDRKGKAWVKDICLGGCTLYFSETMLFHSVLAFKKSLGEAGTGCLYHSGIDGHGIRCVEFKGDKNELDGRCVLGRLLFEFSWIFPKSLDFEDDYAHSALWIEPPTL